MSEDDRSDGLFPMTRWTAVMKLKEPHPTREASDALASLCQQYWYPLYAFARRSGRSPHDAQDAAQAFFCYVLEKNLFAAADPTLGKMRTFLLHAFQRFMNGLRAKENAQKRGGGQEILSLDFDEGEKRYQNEPSHNLTPEALYEKTWALSVISSSLEQLGKLEAAAGRGAQFAALSEFLVPDGSEHTSYADVSAQLKMSEEAMRQALSRLRKRFRDVLRQHVADTLAAASPELVDDEIHSLKAAIVGAMN